MIENTLYEFFLGNKDIHIIMLFKNIENSPKSIMIKSMC